MAGRYDFASDNVAGAMPEVIEALIAANAGVASGYGTDHAGEAELSAWQAGRGLRGAGMYVATSVMTNALLGVVLAPRRTLAAFQGAHGRGSLFDMAADYDSLLDRTVGELREMLGIPQRGLAAGPRGLHAHAPGARSAEPASTRAAE